MTIQNLYTKQRPDIIYNVINGREELPVNAEFARDDDSTYVDSNGVIKAAAPNVPRFNHNPTTLELEGLMLESAGINKILHSSNMTDSVWSSRELIRTANATVAPDGANTGLKIAYTNGNSGEIGQSVDVAAGKYYTQSCFVKKAEWNYVFFWMRDASGFGSTVELNLETGESRKTDTNNGDVFREFSFKVTPYKNGWYRMELTSRVRSAIDAFQPRMYIANTKWEDLPDQNYGTVYETGDGSSGIYTWGWQVNEGYYAQSYLPTTNSIGSRVADELTLTSTKDFDPGFSLLLDSDTTTEDKLYSIKKADNVTELAYLKNDGGTLEWWVNGTSAQTAGTYPQVGFQLGRVRTISSFATAGDALTPNYLYTTGLSFPTVATAGPGSGAKRIEFGVPQTLKALYIWPGQLDPTNAVSLIKGKFRLITPDSFKPGGNEFVFVYNTDPEDAGVKTITLIDIKPNPGSMTVKWGDDTEDTYSEQAISGGVVPSHEYPYPGQYRIQVFADGGYNVVTFGNNPNGSITRVDQWAPQHRVGAPGGGFTGDDAKKLLRAQTNCEYVPPFEYTDLTTIENIYTNLGKIQVTEGGVSWGFVPTQLQECTDMGSAFSFIAGSVSTTEERANFPQLVTSNKLESINSLFVNAALSGFVTSENVPTNRPITDTTGVTDFSSAFLNCRLTDIELDTDSAVKMRSCFQGNKFVTMPNLGFSTVTDLGATWFKCSELTGFDSKPDTSSCTNFNSTWKECTSLSSFPLINTSSGTTFLAAWSDCTALTDFPAGMFNFTGLLKPDAFNEAFANCALTPESIENILVSLDTNGASSIELSIDGGTNAAKASWTDAANTAYDNLIAKGWTISLNS